MFNGKFIHGLNGHVTLYAVDNVVYVINWKSGIALMFLEYRAEIMGDSHAF